MLQTIKEYGRMTHRKYKVVAVCLLLRVRASESCRPAWDYLHCRNGSLMPTLKFPAQATHTVHRKTTDTIHDHLIRFTCVDCIQCIVKYVVVKIELNDTCVER